MYRIPLIAAVCVVIAIASVAKGEVTLTASVYDTPGLPGFWTYDITASSSAGFLNGFSFYGADDGISGPLHQATPGMDFSSAGGISYDSLFSTGGSVSDSHWLVPEGKGIYVGASQSAEGLYAAYTFLGSSGLRDTFRSMPLARLVTNDPAAVSLTGDFAINQFWNDGTDLGTSLFGVNTLLSDIPVAAAPVYDTFPAVPDNVLAERQQQLDAEAEWQAQVAAQVKRREESRRVYEEQRAAELARQAEKDRIAIEPPLTIEEQQDIALLARLTDELNRLSAEQSQIPTEELTPGGEAGITRPLDPLSDSEEGLIFTIEHPELGVVRPTPGWAGGEYLTIDLARGSEIDFLIDFTSDVTNQLYDAASLSSGIVLRSWATAGTTVAYDSDALTFSTFSLAADNAGTTATPEPGAGLLVAIGMAGLAGRCRRTARS